MDMWTRWNFDPLVWAGLLVPIYLFVHGGRRLKLSTERRGAFWAGMATLFVALVSPLDVISHDLFTAHMIQHLLLIVVAAPLLVFAQPLPAFVRGLPTGSNRVIGRIATRPTMRTLLHGLASPLGVTALHLLAIALWHIPALYGWALHEPLAHLAEHAAFFGTALLFWWMLLHHEALAGRVLAVFAVMMTTGLLGALMTFARSPWYAEHVTGVQAWGISALEDQHLAGMLMWVPSSLVYVGFVVVMLAQWIEQRDRQDLLPALERIEDAR